MGRSLASRGAPATRPRFLLFVLLIAVAGVGLTHLVGSALVAPAGRSIGPPPPFLPAESVRFPSRSGGSLAGWYAAGPRRSGAVVLMHSVRSNRLEMVERARFLFEAGYAVLLFDAQAHGESPGRAITFGYLESHDARAAVSFVRSRLPDERVGFLGVSQGGASALVGETPLDVDALVIEAVYPTLREAVENRVAIRLGRAGRLLAPLLLVPIRLRLGFAPGELEPIRGISRVEAPLLLIAGGRDARTTVEESRRLFEAASPPKWIWILPEAAHQDFHRFSGAEYEGRVLGFLEPHLRPGAGSTSTPRRRLRSPP